MMMLGLFVLCCAGPLAGWLAGFGDVLRGRAVIVIVTCDE